MAFTGDEGEMIDPKVAQQWIDNYAKSAGPGAIKAEFFGFRKLSELLAQDQALGVRIYFAKDDAGVNKLVIVAASAEQKNLAPIDGTTSAGLVLEMGGACPPYCNVAD